MLFLITFVALICMYQQAEQGSLAGACFWAVILILSLVFNKRQHD